MSCSVIFKHVITACPVPPVMKVMSTPPLLAFIWNFIDSDLIFIRSTLYIRRSSEGLVLIKIYVGKEERILEWRPPNICLAMVYHGTRNINHT